MTEVNRKPVGYVSQNGLERLRGWSRHDDPVGISGEPETRLGRSIPLYERVPDSAPVLWIDFADNGNVRFWTSEPERADREKRAGRHLRGFTLSELVALVAHLGELRRCVETLRPFTSRPIGAPGSNARQEQDDKALAYDRAVEILGMRSNTEGSQ